MIKHLAILSALVLAGCAQPVAEPAFKGTDIRGSTIGGAFALTGEDGKRYTDQSFAGRYRMVYFGFAYCPDACPADVAVMMRGFAKFEREQPAAAAKVQPLFVTTDPERDDAKTVGEFTAAFHPRLLGLTGTRAEVDTAIKAFKVLAVKEPAPKGSTGYLINHSRFAYLLDPDGKPLIILPVDQGADAVAADLAAMVK